MITTAQRLAKITAAAVMAALIVHIVAADPLGRHRADMAITDKVRYAPKIEWICAANGARVCSFPLPDEELE